MRFTLSPFTATAVLLCAAAPGHSSAASNFSEIYGFTGEADGSAPNGPISDANGALYGTVSSTSIFQPGGVWKLTPPAAGRKRWVHSALYNFTGGADGATPVANLLADGSGALYGTTSLGGTSGEGVVFRLTPSEPGRTAWTETVLHAFGRGADGAQPWCTLIADSSGNLYGTTIKGGSGAAGTVFELSPPALGQTSWTETVLYNFTGKDDGGMPFSGLLFGSDGSLYGTAFIGGQYKYGTVYQLTTPENGSNNWGFTLLHSFTGGKDGGYPRASLIADSTGALYGDTSGNQTMGTVFKLTKSGSGWTENVIYEVKGQYIGDGPSQALSIDSAGALYGTTLGDGKTQGGSLFKLTPPAPGSSKWAESTLRNFKLGGASEFPNSSVLLEPGGKLVGASAGSVGLTGGLIPGDVWQISQ